MTTRRLGALSAIATLALAACHDLPSTTEPTASAAALSEAFATIPVGYSAAQSTYDSDAEGIGPFFTAGEHHGMGRGPGPGMGHGMRGMIGGGLGLDFLGGFGLGRGFGHGHRHGDPALDDDNCTFNAASGRVECAASEERHGLSVVRSVSYTTASGAVQQAFDSLTNTVNTKVQVTGTFTRRDSAVTTISNSSDRTVSGLAAGSTQHIVNGTALGNESTTGTDSLGAFTAVRAAADTISGVVIPIVDQGRSYPTAGTIVRVMKVTVTRATGTPTESTRREVITYDGSATANLVITQDGTTRTCTLPLPFGHPTCS